MKQLKTDEEGRPYGLITLPCYGIVVTIPSEGLGCIASDLHEGPTDEDDDPSAYNAAMDAVESMILAHACAGIDITNPQYIEGIQTAVQACANNL